ncbi:uncharacterized protein METZ01_LOCUS278561 [marine metagenome]|uniref:Uncharacterized protein n=1 Tax=marine metagenome TaxID=408172 RepID=A0A382KSA0_9ZZZZ
MDIPLVTKTRDMLLASVGTLELGF